MLKKTILLGLTAVLMTACGTNDSGGASSSRGSGECVDVASLEVAVGLTRRIKQTNYSGGKVTNSIITSSSVDEFTETSSKETLYDDNENIMMKIESEHFISDGYIRVTKTTIDWLSYPDSEITMKPYNQSSIRIGKNCKGDISEVKYTGYTKIAGQEKTIITKNHWKSTIEDINIEKTVTAGTFNTIKVRGEDFKDTNNYSTDYSYSWIDIDTFTIVLVETYNEDDELIEKIEALDIH